MSHSMIDGRYVPVVPARGISAVIGYGNRMTRACRYCWGMVLWLAPAYRVTVHFGHVRIVNFLQKITDMPGCER